jgi:hypothetical protein
MEAPEKLKLTSVLPAQSPVEIIRLLGSLADSHRRNELKEIPRATLYLSGASFSGYVIGIKDEGDATFIMLVEHDEAVRGSGVSTIYLPLWSVVAVKVQDIEQFVQFLSGGKIETVKQNAPTITSLRKKIADETINLRTLLQIDIKLEVSWETLAQDELTLVGLYELIDEFMKVLQVKMSDEFQRIVFKNMFSRIRFQNANEAEIYYDEQILIVRADLKAREPGRFTRDEFSAALDEIMSQPIE